MPGDVTLTIATPTAAMLFIALTLRLCMVDFHHNSVDGNAIDGEASDGAFAVQVALLWWVLHLFYWLVRWQ